MLTKEELPECPVATTVSLIGSNMEVADYPKPAGTPLAIQ